ncbi:MAG: DUF2953 domain-containing protein [Rhizobacter sp.]|nr:DUF2953 domain-containing protein [Rhizobacter sp.]
MGTAWLVTLLVAGPLLLLAVPLHVTLRFEGIEAFGGELELRWLFGLVRFRVQIPGEGKKATAAGAIVSKAREQPRPGGGGAHVLAALRQAAFRSRLYRLVNDLVAAVHPRELRLRVRLGLGDPADTGRLWALLGPLNAAAQDLSDAQVRIEPEFIDAVLEFQAHGRLLLVPLQILALAAGFALSPASIRAWRALRSGDA